MLRANRQKNLNDYILTPPNELIYSVVPGCQYRYSKHANVPVRDEDVPLIEEIQTGKRVSYYRLKANLNQHQQDDRVKRLAGKKDFVYRDTGKMPEKNKKFTKLPHVEKVFISGEANQIPNLEQARRFPNGRQVVKVQFWCEKFAWVYLTTDKNRPYYVPTALVDSIQYDENQKIHFLINPITNAKVYVTELKNYEYLLANTQKIDTLIHSQFLNNALKCARDNMIFIHNSNPEQVAPLLQTLMSNLPYDIVEDEGTIMITANQSQHDDITQEIETRFMGSVVFKFRFEHEGVGYYTDGNPQDLIEVICLGSMQSSEDICLSINAKLAMENVLTNVEAYHSTIAGRFLLKYKGENLFSDLDLNILLSGIILKPNITQVDDSSKRLSNEELAPKPKRLAVDDRWMRFNRQNCNDEQSHLNSGTEAPLISQIKKTN